MTITTTQEQNINNLIKTYNNQSVLKYLSCKWVIKNRTILTLIFTIAAVCRQCQKQFVCVGDARVAAI